MNIAFQEELASPFNFKLKTFEESSGVLWT